MRRCWGRAGCIAILGCCLAMLARPAAALQIAPTLEVQEAHALQQRILTALPQLAARQPRDNSRLSPEILRQLQERMETLRTQEADNPFLDWAEGVILQQTDDPGSARTAFERAAKAAGSRFLVHWLLWQDFLARSLDEAAVQEEARLQEIMVRWGLSRFPLLSSELIRYAGEAMDSGDADRAFILYGRAASYTPEMPRALIGLAAATWQAHKLRFMEAGWDVLCGLAPALRTGIARSYLSRNLLLSLTVAWLAVLCLVAGIFGLKTQPLFAHEVLRHGVIRVAPEARFGLGLLLFLLPLALGLGLVWTAVWAMLVSAPFLTRREGLLVSALFVGLAIMPIGYRWIATGHLRASSPHLALAQAVERGERGEGLVGGLRQWSQEGPDSGLASYYLGLVLKRRGDLEGAQAAMAKAGQERPRAAFVQVGLGNLDFLQGRVADAEAAYLRAVDQGPPSATVQMNLAQVYAQRMQLDQYDLAVARSLKLDPHMLSTVSRFHAAGVTGLVSDESVPWDVLAGAVTPPPAAIEEVAEGLWGSPLRGIRLPVLPGVAAGLLLIFWGYRFARRESLPARHCEECGRIFCGTCRTSAKERRYCPRCAGSGQREGVAAVVRTRRLRETEEWLAREQTRTEVLGTLLPGGSDLYSGRLLPGFLLCLAGVWIALEGLLLPALTPSLRLPSPLPWTIRWLAALAVLSGLYFVSRRRCRQKPEPQMP